MTMAKVSARNSVFREGDDGDCLYIVINGRIGIFITMTNPETGN